MRKRSDWSYRALDDIYAEDGFALQVYEKMQWLRGGYRSTAQFKSLAESMRNNGFDPSFPIQVDRSGTLVNGSHRLACALYLGLDQVPVTCVEERFDRDYRMNWFEDNSFDGGEITHIKSAVEDVFFKGGLNFPIIIWPHLYAEMSRVLQIISSKYEILSVRNLSLDGDGISKFTAGICQTDNIAPWKLDRKISKVKMAKSYNVGVVYCKVPSPTWRKKENDQVLSVEMEELKNYIRSLYRDGIDGYIQDILIHVADNPRQSILINKYLSENHA